MVFRRQRRGRTSRRVGSKTAKKMPSVLKATPASTHRALQLGLDLAAASGLNTGSPFKKTRGRPRKVAAPVTLDSDSESDIDKSEVESERSHSPISLDSDSDLSEIESRPQKNTFRRLKAAPIILDTDDEVNDNDKDVNSSPSNDTDENHTTSQEGQELKRANSSFKWDENFDLAEFIGYRSTSNTEANFNNNGPEKSAMSHKIDDDHDDDFFDNLPDVDVNEFSASKKCKNKNTPKSSIVDYLKTGTASSENVNNLSNARNNCRRASVCKQLISNYEVEEPLQIPTPSLSQELSRDESITTSLKRCIDFNEDSENLHVMKKSKINIENQLNYSREPLRQIDPIIINGNEQNISSSDSEEENMEDSHYENSQNDSNDTNMPFRFLTANEDINFDINNLLRNSTGNFQVNNLGERARETYYQEQVDTAQCIVEMYDEIKSMPKDGVENDPDGLTVELMKHQKESLKWMKWRETKKAAGGILADDMGLGKTLQLISLVLSTKNDKIAAGIINEDEDDYDFTDREDSDSCGKIYDGRTLVICPSVSLLEQWKKEVLTKVERNRLKVFIYHGKEAMSDIELRELSRIDIVLATYNCIQQEKKWKDVGSNSRNENPKLFKIHWERVILDEAHFIRNVTSLTNKGACELRAKARWALTGTPIQNRRDDFFALLKFLQCKPFDDYHVWKGWVNNENTAGNQRLVVISKSIMLRRTKVELMEKGDIKKLPDKKYDLIYVKLDSKERIVYEKMFLYCNAFFEKFLKQKSGKEHLREFGSHERPSVMSRDVPDKFLKLLQLLSSSHKEIGMNMIFVLILRLRQMCCHPALAKSMLDFVDLDPDSNDNQIDQKMVSELDKFLSDDEDEDYDFTNVNPDRVMSKTNEVFDNKRIGSKVKAILKVIRKILIKDQKVIVVSQWTGFLQVIANSLHVLRDHGAVWAMFTGKVSQANRQDIIDRLNCDHDRLNIILLSLTAGGVGLNLVGANNLLLIDLHWNPQWENQAQDRIYRFGQRKNVHVYKFICKDTIEEKIKQLQDDKLAIADNLLNGKVNNRLTIEDLKKLFSLNDRNPFGQANGEGSEESEEEDEDDDDDDDNYQDIDIADLIT